MKSLKEIMSGKDYANKMESFDKKMIEIRNAYKGRLGIDERLLTMKTNQETGRPFIKVDESVPVDIRNHIIKEFDTIWK